MHSGMIAAVAGLGLAYSASAAFVGFAGTLTQVATSGVLLDQIRLYARFNGPSDTLLSAFNFQYVGGATSADPYAAFFHKDNSDYNGGVLSRQYGSWAPYLTGSATANRPYDSFLTIGGTATATNTTNADPSWSWGGSGAHAGGASGWNRPDLLNNGSMGWFNSSPPNLQGRVGVAPNTLTDILIGQFVVERNSFAGMWRLTVGYNDDVHITTSFATAELCMGVPAPGALALLGLGGLVRRRAR